MQCDYYDCYFSNYEINDDDAVIHFKDKLKLPSGISLCYKCFVMTRSSNKFYHYCPDCPNVSCYTVLQDRIDETHDCNPRLVHSIVDHCRTHLGPTQCKGGTCYYNSSNPRTQHIGLQHCKIYNYSEFATYDISICEGCVESLIYDSTQMGKTLTNDPLNDSYKCQKCFKVNTIYYCDNFSLGMHLRLEFFCKSCKALEK